MTQQGEISLSSRQVRKRDKCFVGVFRSHHVVHFRARRIQERNMLHNGMKRWY